MDRTNVKILKDAVFSLFVAHLLKYYNSSSQNDLELKTE